MSSYIQRIEMQSAQIDTAQGTLQYREAGNPSGPIIVFIHGLFLGGAVWNQVIENLVPSYRCIVLEMPFGAHRAAMNGDADLSPVGAARLVQQSLEALDVSGVTLVGGDFGAVVGKIVTAQFGERVARLVIANCDALEVFPAEGFKYFEWLPSLPGGMWAMAQLLLRVRNFRRHKTVFGGFSHSPIPDEWLVDWLTPLATQSSNRKDVAKMLVGMDNAITLALPSKLRDAEIPILIVWGADDDHFPIDLACRLRKEIGAIAQLVEIPDAKTFVFLDAPERFSDAIIQFCHDTFEPSKSLAAEPTKGW